MFPNGFKCNARIDGFAHNPILIPSLIVQRRKCCLVASLREGWSMAELRGASDALSCCLGLAGRREIEYVQQPTTFLKSLRPLVHPGVRNSCYRANSPQSYHLESGPGRTTEFANRKRSCVRTPGRIKPTPIRQQPTCGVHTVTRS